MNLKVFQSRIKNLFDFSSSERRGVIVLLSLILFVLIINLFFRFISFDETTIDEKQWLKVEQFLQEKAHRKESLKADLSEQSIYTIPEYFSFDPNSLSSEAWKKLGLETWQIKIINNYLRKGGQFKIKSDLRNIYGISDTTYYQLEPYILLPDREVVPAKPLTPDLFNPNTVSDTILIKFGFDTYIVNSIINYREKGGRFFKKDDFRKIYGITDSIYSIIEKYIDLPEQVKNETVQQEIFREIDINVADSLDLQQLPGIGPSFARRIITYRELLGGYVNKSQLMEVYGMDSSRYKLFKDQILISVKDITKIDINNTGIKGMIKHPYIEFYMAKAIILKREELQGFDNIEQIKDLDVIYDALFDKLKPYLSIGNASIVSKNKDDKDLR